MLKLGRQALVSSSVRSSSRYAGKDARSSYIALSTFFRNQQDLSRQNDQNRMISVASRVKSSYTSRLASQIGQNRGLSTSRRLQAINPNEKKVDPAVAQEETQAGSSTSGHTKSPLPDTLNEGRKREVLAHVSKYPKSLQALAMSLPSSGFHRPTKDELLSATSNFFERLRIRFKWFTIRGFRRFRADDWSAFVSWLIGGVGIWIVVGTTSFFSFVFLILKPLQAQEWLATWLGSYLTSQSGITIVFESAIVPKFSLKDSKLTFKNVYLSRGLEKHSSLSAEDASGDSSGVTRRKPTSNRVRRVSSEDLADLRSRSAAQSQARTSTPIASTADTALASAEDGAPQYTHFHLSVDSIEVSLSLPRWLDGKGLVKEASVRGVRGVIDRSHIQHLASSGDQDHRRFRHKAQPGDFHLENLAIEDFLVTVYQPDNFRPYTFSIFSATINNLRKQWLFFDLLSADSITGQVDNCLFSLHRPQSIGRTSEEDKKDTTWKRMSRFRVDGVPVDHLQTSRDTGPLAWIDSGRADLVADIRFPHEPGDDVDLNTIIGDIVDNLDEALRAPSNPPSQRIPGRPELAKGKALEAPATSLRSMLGIEGDTSSDDVNRIVSIDLDIRFKDVKATIPLFNSDLSHVNNALVRPIVAFINSNRTLIPVRCHLDIGLEEFDGSWTTYDIGLLEAVSEQVYSALAHHVHGSQAKRAKAVGLWSLQKSAAAILVAFRQNLEHL